MMLNERPRLVYIVTVPATARVLLKGQLGFMRRSGYDVTVIASPGPELDAVAAREGVRVVGVPMKRDVAPRSDARSLSRLVRVLSELKPHIVNSSTTKAGLLGTVAARLTGVPIRLYLLRGLRLETTSGLTRSVLAGTEQLAVACATDVIAVSDSLRDAFANGGYCRPPKLRVLGSGSSNGVNVAAFERTSERVARAAAIRERLGIAADAVVLGFLGRPVSDKGMKELLAAFQRLAPRKVALLLVGDSFAGDDMGAALAAEARRAPGVFTHPSVADPSDYLAVFDVLAFPSFREGLPNVPLEAAASGIPTVGFRVTGVRDAVIDGETGTLVDAGDVPAFAAALARYVDDPDLRHRHGGNAYARARREFSNDRVWRLWRDEYAALCRRHGVPVPQPEIDAGAEAIA